MCILTLHGSPTTGSPVGAQWVGDTSLTPTVLKKGGLCPGSKGLRYCRINIDFQETKLILCLKVAQQ